MAMAESIPVLTKGQETSTSRPGESKGIPHDLNSIYELS